jgi:DNA-binding response OmpR family regulator
MEAILIAEDEALIAATLADALSDEGFEVLQCATGREALRLMRTRRRFAALVADIRLPEGIWGNEVAAAFRLQHPKGQIIFITGAPYPIGVLPPGLRDASVLLKPFQPHDLVRHGATAVGRLASQLNSPATPSVSNQQQPR